MFSKIIRFLPVEDVIRIVPSLIVNLLGDFIDKEITQERQDQAKKYLQIADYANEALDVIIEILNCIIDNKEVDPNLIDKLERWSKGLPKK